VPYPVHDVPVQANGLSRIQKHEPAAAQVHQRLRRAILDGTLKPGERLVETTLASGLGVSRTPVREALSKLEAEHLVAQSTAVGLTVVDTAAAQPEELVGLRQRLEGLSARLAAKRITPEELDELENIVSQAKSIRAGSISRQAELDEKFHLLIAEATHSTRLFRLVAYQYSVTANLSKGTRLSRDHLAQHQKLLLTLRAHNVDLADRIAFAHAAASSLSRSPRPGR
jgi:DNA-binding GntR family transcriptional regulator